LQITTCRITFHLPQLTFSLLDLIQLGDIVPHYNTIEKKSVADWHEIHDYEDKLLISHFSKFDDKFRELVLKPQIDEYSLQSTRGKTYHKYKAIVNTQEKSTTHVTAENIHEVKVVLLFDRQFHDISKDGRKWKYSPFKILHPH
jgi:hypothetical protein